MASLDSLLHEIRRIEENRVTLTEKRIKSIYKSLEKNLQSFIADEYVKYSDKDGKLFLEYLGKNKRAKFLEEIVKNVDSVSPQVKEELLELVDKTYEKAYMGISNAVKNADDTKDLLKGVNTLVTPEVLNRAVRNNIDKLTLNSVMEKARAEIIADIQQALTTGLMNGERYETMAKRIQERIGVSYSKASNIARTESHRNTESGLMDGAKETAKIIDKDGNLIYAATWVTMKDQRVRPQQRRKTKKGWVTTISKNGANHQKMKGVTIKVGEKFQLEPDVFAECPGMSGTARNDCRCRCFLRYRLMTPEEFHKHAGRNITLTDKQIEALKDYTGIYGQDINAYMNGKKAELTEKEETVIDVLHNILGRTIVERDCVLYRGSSLEVFGAKAKSVLSNPQNAIGLTLTNKGFMSLTSNVKVAKTFSSPKYDKLILYEMDVPKGAKGLDISKLSVLGYEEETILQDHTSFIINDVMEDNEKIIFKCSVLK